MPRPAPHAAAVNAEDELFCVENLRELRLAHDVMRLFLPTGMASDAITAALQEIHKLLCNDEDELLRSLGVPDRYLIIRPINPYSPPSPEDMQRITDAVQTLATLGMLAGRGDSRLPGAGAAISGMGVTSPGCEYTLA
jgi:hypothetical protein